MPAVDKAARVLRALADGGRPQGISELARALNVSKGTLRDVLLTLAHFGFVVRDPDTRFRLGPELRGTKGPRHWAPPSASPGSWGHAGATGCVAWHDPAAEVAWFIAGTRTAENGWLLDAGPRVGAAVLQAYGKPRSMYE